jgi:hypothetical protein
MSGEQLVVDLIAEIRRCLEALGRGSVGIGGVLDVLGD